MGLQADMLDMATWVAGAGKLLDALCCGCWTTAGSGEGGPLGDGPDAVGVDAGPGVPLAADC